MKLYLNEKIKKMRLEHNWTQEQLAERLDVSAQAISRWETNSTFPDIEMIPDIASIFEISVDELLGVNDSINQNKIQKVLDEADSYYASGDIEKMVFVIEQGIKENPISTKLSLKLMEALFSLYNDQRENTCKRVIELGNKIIDKLKHLEDKCKVYQMMTYTYLELGNLEQAKVFAEKLPKMVYSQELVLPLLETTDKKGELLQYNIQMLSNHLIIQLEKLSFSNCYKKEDKIKILNKIHLLLGILFENKDYGYELYLLENMNMNIFEILVSDNKLEEACKYLEDALKYAKAFDEVNSIQHTSLLNNKTVFDKNQNFGKDYQSNEVDRIISSLKNKNMLKHKKIEDVLEKTV